MKLGFAADHGGFELKQILIAHAKELGYECVDYGTHSIDSVDYPDYAEKLARAIQQQEIDHGVAICGTGIGISIACNKFAGVRAALCHDTFSARATRQHNDANILCLGGRVTGVEIAKDILENYCNATFEGGRHQKRVEKICNIEIKEG